MTNMCIRNVTILTPFETIKDGAILLHNGIIKWVGKSSSLVLPPNCLVYDAFGNILTPGWIDIQINGAFGFDFTSQPESIWDVASQLPQFGITSFLPTIITSPLNIINRAQHIIANPPTNFVGAVPLGLHVEGPFINPQKAGAHNINHILHPDIKLVKHWSKKTGIRMVTLAPELPGAIDVIRFIANNGIVVSAGHSQASLEDAYYGFAAGISCGTHLFNAMPSITHHNPGLVGALLEHKDSCFGMIVDGIHIHPTIIAMVWQLAKSQRIFLVTDAMSALGMPHGKYLLGDVEVSVDSSARLLNGALAGSILSMDQAIRNLLKFTKCSVEDAIRCVTYTPAKVLREDRKRGRIAPNIRGDLVLLTSDLQVVMTIVQGEVVYKNSKINSIKEHIQ